MIGLRDVFIQPARARLHSVDFIHIFLPSVWTNKGNTNCQDRMMAAQNMATAECPLYSREKEECVAIRAVSLPN